MPSRSSAESHDSHAHPDLFPQRDGGRREDEDRVTSHVPVSSVGGERDRVTSQRHFRTASAMDTARTGAATLVMPDLRQIIAVVAPDLVTTGSIALAYLVASMSGTISALFIVPLVVPGLILSAFQGGGVGHGWREAMGVNLGTMLVLFPLLIIRQSTVRVPYLDLAHGTVYAAVFSTMAVLVVLIGLALCVAWISREDPESAAVLFMPAALLVPLLTSATEFARLDSALLVAGLIFLLASILTLVTSVIPPAYSVFVVPFAVACEVLFVTVIRQDRIFPIGVNEAGMALFATVVVAAIALVATLPSLSSWMGRVDRFRAAHHHSAGELS